MTGPIFVEQALDLAQEYLRQADTHWDSLSFDQEHNQVDDDDRHEEIIKYSLTNAWRAIITVAQVTGQSFITEEARAEFAQCLVDPVKWEHGLEDRYLVWSGAAHTWVRLLRSMCVQHKKPVLPLGVSNITEIIRGLETYVVNYRVFGWRPTREDDVHVRIEGALGGVYPDTQHKPAISKPIKNFEPDTGIPSARVLIEYKFITTEDEGKRALDEILADISAYTSNDYDDFIFVVYETDRVFPEDRWNAHLKADGIGNHVSVIVLKGVPATETDRARALEARGGSKKPADKIPSGKKMVDAAAVAPPPGIDVPVATEKISDGASSASSPLNAVGQGESR